MPYIQRPLEMNVQAADDKNARREDSMAVSVRAHEPGEDRLKRELQVKLVELQDCVRHEAMKICIVFARCRLSGTCQGSSTIVPKVH